MYTNIVGLIPRKPESVCLAETKSSEGTQTNIENPNNYRIWMKDSKGKNGSGAMIMIKPTRKVINVEYGKGKTELSSGQITTKCGEKKQ